MATRQPNVQTRGQYGSYWGVYALITGCPNGTTYPLTALDTALATPLEAGDIAYVPGTGLVQCTSAGTIGGLDAAWAAIGGAGGQDRFAPTHLVGNTFSGDSAVAYNVAGFNYYPDDGDCVQLAAALAAAATDGGQVFIRRGIYDLGAVGAPVGPLTIAPRVWVHGEGRATIIIAAPTLDQGVFTMSPGGGAQSTLTDIFIESIASDAGSLGSDALVLGERNVSIRNVSFSLVTAAGGQLREALRISNSGGGPLPGATLDNINIEISSSTGAASPTIGLHLRGSPFRTACQHFECSGGDIALRTESAIFTCDTYIAMGWAISSVVHTGPGGSIRLHNGATTPSILAVAAIAFDLQEQDHYLENIDIGVGALDQAIAVRMATPATFNGPGFFDKLSISGYETGIQLGDTATAASVSGGFITNCQIQASSVAVRLADGCSDCHVQGNNVSALPGGSAAVLGGILVGTGGAVRNHIEDNDVEVNDVLVTAYGIQVLSPDSFVGRNHVRLTDGLWGIEVDAEDCNVSNNHVIAAAAATLGALHLGNRLRIIAQGNYCDFAQAVYTTPAILVDGQNCIVSNNVTRVTSAAPAPSPGISLSGFSASCNAIGNVSEGSPIAPIVANVGLGNNVALNVGV